VSGKPVETIDAEPDLAAVGGHEAADHVEERGLARAVRSDETRDRTFADGERAAGERLDAAEALGDAGDGEELSRDRFPRGLGARDGGASGFSNRRVSYVRPWDPATRHGFTAAQPSVIGRTLRVAVDLLDEELPDVEVLANVECSIRAAQSTTVPAARSSSASC